MLNSIDSTIRYFDNLIENNKSGLKRGKINKNTNRFCIRTFTFLNLLTPTTQSSEFQCYFIIKVIKMIPDAGDATMSKHGNRTPETFSWRALTLVCAVVTPSLTWKLFNDNDI